MRFEERAAGICWYSSSNRVGVRDCHDIYRRISIEYRRELIQLLYIGLAVVGKGFRKMLIVCNANIQMEVAAHRSGTR